MREYKDGTELIFHSSNGMDYKVVVVSYNAFREPGMEYAVDIWDGNGIYAGDVYFVGEDFLNKCEIKN